MSDILIKNMEMPKSCEECMFLDRHHYCVLARRDPWSPYWANVFPPVPCPLYKFDEKELREKFASFMDDYEDNSFDKNCACEVFSYVIHSIKFREETNG